MRFTTGTSKYDKGHEYIAVIPPILSSDGRSVLRYTTYTPTRTTSAGTVATHVSWRS